jgi:hypothetical protein
VRPALAAGLCALALACTGEAGDTSSNTPVDGCQGVADAGQSDAATDDIWVAPIVLGRDLKRDIQHMDLALDLATKKGIAKIRMAPATGSAASFYVSGLKVQSVRLGDGDLVHAVSDGILDVAMPAASGPTVLRITYGFDTVGAYTFQGWMPSGSTLLWPYWCDNLFPCHPSPADGLT